MLQKFKGQVITAGYDWAIQLGFDKSPITFPANATFTAHVRRDPNAEDILATLTTANGSITRISEKILQLRLPGSMSIGWPERTAYIDMVRTDSGLKQHLGFMLTVPVRRAITRGI
ncbi:MULTISPECIES: hypothetical protein [unclassified Ensifer]|uniref:hypothetical protein n=1 Tax=unclassified Ensifer TaxID=2633371 RepID=UPI000813CA76|nr:MULTISPECIES: hypothetical protein [unclassified Ensifer]OCP21882.1 hypothetical protein BC361_25270 [Ensifer sp. LC54]OCP23338.1 hypothetical protein BC363_25495 [Ensifer sp. LC384]